MVPLSVAITRFCEVATEIENRQCNKICKDAIISHQRPSSLGETLQKRQCGILRFHPTAVAPVETAPGTLLAREC